jgi:hypothetical protein
MDARRLCRYQNGERVSRLRMMYVTVFAFDVGSWTHSGVCTARHMGREEQKLTRLARRSTRSRNLMLELVGFVPTAVPGRNGDAVDGQAGF